MDRRIRGGVGRVGHTGLRRRHRRKRAAVRARICDGLGFLGIELDEKRNAAEAAVISADTGRVTVRVIHTDEELMIAKSVVHVLKLGSTQES